MLTPNTVFTVKPDYSVSPLRQQQYRILSLVRRESEIASWYRGLAVTRGNQEVYLRISVNTSSTIRNLLKNEQRILTLLQHNSQGPQFGLLLPQLIEAFDLPQSVGTYRVNVFVEKTGSWLSLEEMRQIFPQGFPPKHMAWITRRILSVLGYAYGKKIMHGAVTPTHILVHGPWHGLNLLDWEYAVHNPHVSRETINNIPFDQYFEWYPQWVFDLEGPKPYMDTVMAIRCMAFLLGGDLTTGEIPFHTEIEPDEVYELIERFLIDVIRSNNHDLTASDALEQFSEDVLERLWSRGIWEKTFYPFPDITR